MEVYLKDTSNNTFRFPVIPPTINIQDYAIMNDSNITAVGDITVFGGKGLRSTEISSFFPNPKRKYSFVNYSDYPKQYECVEIIKKWMDTGTKLRFIVTDTEINFLVKITNFEYSEQNGTRDVYYTLSLKEFREIAIPGLNSNTQATDKTQNTPRKDTPNNNVTNKLSEILSIFKNNTAPTPNKNNPALEKIHTVKKGDTLWDISKQYYGTGKDYKKIMEANKEKYQNLKKNTIIKPDWKLNIP